MTNKVDEFIESLVVATIAKEVQWNLGTPELQGVLEEVYGNSENLYYFEDTEAGANVVLATYKYYEGEVAEDEFMKDGVSVLLIDDDDYEILNEVTDEDIEDAELFSKLLAAVQAKLK